MARKSSLTFMAVLAEVSIKSKPVSSAYVWASFTIQDTNKYRYKISSHLKNTKKKPKPETKELKCLSFANSSNSGEHRLDSTPQICEQPLQQLFMLCIQDVLTKLLLNAALSGSSWLMGVFPPVFECSQIWHRMFNTSLRPILILLYTVRTSMSIKEAHICNLSSAVITIHLQKGKV